MNWYYWKKAEREMGKFWKQVGRIYIILSCLLTLIISKWINFYCIGYMIIALYISCALISHPYKTILFEYKKAIGVECWNKASLELFVNSELGVMLTI